MEVVLWIGRQPLPVLFVAAAFVFLVIVGAVIWLDRR